MLDAQYNLTVHVKRTKYTLTLSAGLEKGVTYTLTDSAGEPFLFGYTDLSEGQYPNLNMIRPLIELRDDLSRLIEGYGKTYDLL